MGREGPEIDPETHRGLYTKYAEGSFSNQQGKEGLINGVRTSEWPPGKKN